MVRMQKAVCEKLKTVFGIHSFSVCYQVESDLEKLKMSVYRLLKIIKVKLLKSIQKEMIKIILFIS